jgi:hypothetical protein
MKMIAIFGIGKDFDVVVLVIAIVWVIGRMVVVMMVRMRMSMTVVVLVFCLGRNKAIAVVMVMTTGPMTVAVLIVTMRVVMAEEPFCTIAHGRVTACWKTRVRGCWLGACYGWKQGDGTGG